MGFFDVHCAHSGLALVEDTRLVLLLETDNGWKPLGAPLSGTYDRLGGIDEPEDPSPAFVAFTEWMEELVGESDFEEILFQLRDGEGQWNGHELNYALVDEAVYQALKGPLESADPGIPEALRVGWKRELRTVEPVDLDDTAQYTGVEGEYGCQARIDAARERFRDAPEILAAIAKNEAAWRKNEED